MKFGPFSRVLARLQKFRVSDKTYSLHLGAKAVKNFIKGSERRKRGRKVRKRSIPLGLDPARVPLSSGARLRSDRRRLDPGTRGVMRAARAFFVGTLYRSPNLARGCFEGGAGCSREDRGEK